MHSLCHWSFYSVPPYPPNLKELTFNCKPGVPEQIQYSHKFFPSTLETLSFSATFNQPVTYLPDSILLLNFGSHFNQPIDNSLIISFNIGSSRVWQIIYHHTPFGILSDDERSYVNAGIKRDSILNIRRWDTKRSVRKTIGTFFKIYYY